MLIFVPALCDIHAVFANTTAFSMERKLKFRNIHDDSYKGDKEIRKVKFFTLH